MAPPVTQRERVTWARQRWCEAYHAMKAHAGDRIREATECARRMELDRELRALAHLIAINHPRAQ